MKLEREVRHKSEDISDDVLSDTVKSLGRRARVSHDYDIPYIAGYSTDGRTVFIDRHLPRTFRSWTQTIRVAPFLLRSVPCLIRSLYQTLRHRHGGWARTAGHVADGKAKQPLTAAQTRPERESSFRLMSSVRKGRAGFAMPAENLKSAPPKRG
jgi:hypothetical protein